MREGEIGVESSLDRNCVIRGGDAAKNLPMQVADEDERGPRHRNVENPNNEDGCFPAVIFSVDVDDRQHDEIGVDKGDHAAEADPAVPKHCGERNIAD